MGQVYRWMGLTTGVIINDMDDGARQAAYGSDITYGQNNEFGFDYLRDNMKYDAADYVQRALNFAIIDEVDSILIDESRTPLIISGPAEGSPDLYLVVDKVIPRLKKDIHFNVDEKSHSATLTDEGVETVQRLLKCDNLYDPANIVLLHHVNNALNTLYRRDVNYLVHGKGIIDEHTGRLMPGRRWSDVFIKRSQGRRVDSTGKQTWRRSVSKIISALRQTFRNDRYGQNRRRKNSKRRMRLMSLSSRQTSRYSGKIIQTHLSIRTPVGSKVSVKSRSQA